MNAALTPQTCYVGQTVYWIMWVDPQQDNVAEKPGWYVYKPSRKPEIWYDTVAHIKLRGRKITLTRHPKIDCAFYACAQDAITAEYEDLCKYRLNGYLQPRLSLGEASAVLRALAELEFNLHAHVAKAEE